MQPTLQALFRHFENIMATDWSTIAVIALLCAVASYALKEYLANPPMIIFVYPLLLLLSIVTNYVFTAAEAYSPNKLDQWLMWTIIASIIGTTAGTAMVAAIALWRER